MYADKLRKANILILSRVFITNYTKCCICFSFVLVHFTVCVLVKFDTNQLWVSLTAFVQLIPGCTGMFCSHSLSDSFVRKDDFSNQLPQGQVFFKDAMPFTNIAYLWGQQLLCLTCHIYCSVEFRHILGQFGHLCIMNLFSFCQLWREQSSHDVLKQNCGVVLPVF